MENKDESLHYNYPIKTNLNKAVTTHLDNFIKINLCVYTINTSGKYPFLQYLVIDNSYNTLVFPELPVFSVLSADDLQTFSIAYLSGILKIKNSDLFHSNTEFDGFYEFNQNLYLFFDITKCSINMDSTSLSTEPKFALLDELVNHKNVCNIAVDTEISRLFISNTNMNHLYNENHEPYEIPIVGYVGKSTTAQVMFVSVFGESAKSKSACLGSYFYFTEFNNAVRDGGWSPNYKPRYLFDKLITDNDHGRYSRGGIVRFALFTGYTKHIDNNPNDPNDESYIKQTRINDPSLNNRYEVLTLKITDHDGIWTKTYDSAYLGNVELYDGRFFEDTPLLAIKEYCQQTPLSYHFINKHTLGDKFDANNDGYGIL